MQDKFTRGVIKLGEFSNVPHMKVSFLSRLLFSTMVHFLFIVFRESRISVSKKVAVVMHDVNVCSKILIKSSISFI